MTVALPRLLVVTDRHQLPLGRTLEETVAAIADAGPCLVAVRERDLPPVRRRPLVERLAASLAQRGGTPATQLPAAEPVPEPRPAVLGRSCHDTAELRRARAQAVDYATVSPVAASASKPGYGPVLGRAGLRAVLDDVPGHPPVFALGGVTPGNAPGWLASGAYGVAVMGMVMRARDPAAVCAALHRALG